MVILYLASQGIIKLFSIEATPFDIPTNNVQGFQFLPIPTNTFYFRFFITEIPGDMKWYLAVILICISLLTNGVGYLFVCLLAICISSLEKCLFKYFVHYSMGCCSFCCQITF